jgi:hypothetical protein
MHSLANEASRRAASVHCLRGTPPARSGVSALGNLTSFEGEPPGRLTPTEDQGAGARARVPLRDVLPGRLTPTPPPRCA